MRVDDPMPREIKLPDANPVIGAKQPDQICLQTPRYFENETFVAS